MTGSTTGRGLSPRDRRRDLAEAPRGVMSGKKFRTRIYVVQNWYEEFRDHEQD